MLSIVRTTTRHLPRHVRALAQVASQIDTSQVVLNENIIQATSTNAIEISVEENANHAAHTNLSGPVIQALCTNALE